MTLGRAAVLAAVLVGAAALRLWGIGEWSLWLDEAMQVDYGRPGLKGLLRVLVFDADHPPLDYLVTWAVRRVSESDLALRLPSVLWGLGTALALFVRAGGFAAPLRALPTAFVFAVLPAAVHYDQEVRPYALALFLVAVADAARAEFVASRRRGAFWLSVAASALAANTLYFAALFLAGQFAVELAEAWPRRREDRQRWRAALAAPALSFLAFVPWLVALHWRGPRAIEDPAPAVTWRVAAELLAGLAVDRQPTPRLAAGAVMWALALLGLAALRGWERRRTVLLLAWAIAAPLALLVIRDHWWSLRYVVLAILPLSLAIGAGVERLASWAPPPRRAVAAVAAALVIAACTAPALQANARAARVDWRRPARYLAWQYASGRGGALLAADAWGYFSLRFQTLRLSPPIPLDRILDTESAIRELLPKTGRGWIVRAPRFRASPAAEAKLERARPWAVFAEAEECALYRFEDGVLVPP